MLVWKLCQNSCLSKIDIKPSKKLGDGADGEVFEIENDSDKVIKFCVLYNYENNLEKFYKEISNVINFIKDNNLPSYARVYEHVFLGKYFRELVESSSALSEYILYYYTMEKLYKISDDEKRVFHSVLSHEDSNKIKNYSLPQIKKMLDGMSLGLDFDVGRVMLFCEELKKAPIIHNDLHVRNIMKDKFGNFKLIDFDRCTIKNSII